MLSYDRWNKKADRIYRPDAEINFGGNHIFLAVAPPLAGPSMPFFLREGALADNQQEGDGHISHRRCLTGQSG